MKNKIVIWGRDGFNTLGLLRAYGKAGLDVFFLIKRGRGYASKSKYCIKSHCVESDEEGMQFLLDQFSNETAKPIIITPGDEIAVFINNHKEELEAHFIIPGTVEKGLQEKFTDKNNMTELARSLGILCPESRFCQWNSNLDGVNYPCLIKPAHEKAGHYNEFKYKVCKDRVSLERTLRMVRHDSEFIVQDYIQKEKEILIYGARLSNGQILFAGTLIKYRWSNSGNASYAAAVAAAIPQCINLSGVVSFLDKIDYVGLFSFEFGVVGDKAYFFEVNLRNDATSQYFYQAGANIPLAYAYSCAGLDYSEIPTKVTEDGKWFVDEIFDIENVLAGKLSYLQWKMEKQRASLYKYYDKEDEEPWRYLKRRRGVLIAKEMVVKRFRPYIVYILDKLGIKK